MIIETLSTFPQVFTSYMGTSMMYRAQRRGLLDFIAYDLRDWTHDRHRTTDDDPYGGGAGLIMKCEPIFEAYDDICGLLHSPTHPHTEQGDDQSNSTEQGDEQPKSGPAPQHAHEALPTVIFLTPQGQTFNDSLANELATHKRLLFICGHYEGIDERASVLADYQISLGDYVVTSGELASLVVIDAVVRKLKGVLGAPDGVDNESFAYGLLEYPHYTRPATFRGMKVPEILLSGNHQAIAQWRREQSLIRTARLRPDLLKNANLSSADWEFLKSSSCDGGA